MSTTDRPDIEVRVGTQEDAPTAARLLHDFNTEFGSPTPGVEAITRRLRELLAEDSAIVLAGTPPVGVALLRFRRSIWKPRRECLVAELYVIADERRRGIGRALMNAAIALARERDADEMYLATRAGRTPARALYESLGFTNTGGKPGGPVTHLYEREL